MASVAKGFHPFRFRFGWMMKNLSECINEILKGPRMLPIASLAQATFYKCVNYFEKRIEEIRAALERQDKYTRYAHEKIAKWAARSSNHEVQSYDRYQGVFHVKTERHNQNAKGGNVQILRLSDQYSSCNKWQTFGIPCSHFIAVCSKFNMNYDDFIEDSYKMSTYAACYSHQFQPVPHEDYWVMHPNMHVLHVDQSLLRKLGRSKSLRYRSEMDWREPGAQVRCEFCNQLGYNRKKCTSLRRRAPDN